MGEIKNVKKRDIRLDILKGIAILFVVIGHVINQKYDTVNYNTNWVFKFAYSFHMPLFFFVSGYLCGFKKPESFNIQYIKNRSIRILIPYLIWTTCFNVFPFDSIKLSCIRVLSALFITPLYWFLPCIWFCSVFLVVIVKSRHQIISAVLVWIFCVIVCMVTKSYTKLFTNTVWYFPFYFGAFYLSNNRDKIYGNFIKWILRLSLILYPISLMFYSYPLGRYELRINVPSSLMEIALFRMGVQAYLVVLNKWIISSLGICFFWQLTKVSLNFWQEKFNRVSWLHKLTAWLGFYSLQIYLLHPIMFNLNYSQNLVIDSLVTVLAAIVSSIAIAYIVKHFKKLNTICFGQ